VLIGSFLLVSFGNYARRVRDPSLPYRWRVSALRSCVQLYRPIGFRASLSYLHAVAGPYERDEAALLRALDEVIAGRRLWQAEMRGYAAARLQAKRRGQRCPRPGERNPTTGPDHWYGAAADAALHALRFWRRSDMPRLLATGDVLVGRVDHCVAEVVESGGDLSDDTNAQLGDCVVELGRRLAGDLYSKDALAYFRSRGLVMVAELVWTAASGRPRTDEAP
jgi:hypothetical protein